MRLMTARRAGSGLLLLALAAAALADERAGRVISVSDGDTLTVLVAGQRPVKVRLAGMDAPACGRIRIRFHPGTGGMVARRRRGQNRCRPRQNWRGAAGRNAPAAR